MFQHQQVKGYEVGSISLPHLSSVSLSILIPCGSRNEIGFTSGIAHFLEHMIFKGTTNYSAKELAKTIEQSGCTTNAYTTEDHTVLEFRGPAEHLALMLKIAAEMLWSSTLDEAEVQQECRVITEEIIGYQESPSEHIYDLAAKALWGGQALGSPITGTVESVKKIDRSQLMDFHSSFYLTKGIIVAAAGAIRHEKVLELVSEYFPELRTNKVDHASNVIPIPQSDTITEKADIEQCHIDFSYPTIPATSQMRHSLRVINILFGETMSSRLFQCMREDLGLCYSIHSDYNLFKDIGVFNIYAAIDGEQFDFAIDKLEDTISEFTANPPNDDEVKSAIQFASVQNKLNLEGSQAYAQWIADSLFSFNKIITPESIEVAIQSVSREQLIQFSEELFRPHEQARAYIIPQK